MNIINKNRTFILIGHLYFIMFIAMAAVFFRERTCLADCAYHIFTIIRTGTFAIFQNRYPIAIPQLLPVLGVKLGFSLNTILILYSVSVPLVCYGFYLIVAHKLKDYHAAIAMVLAASMMLTQGFFFTWEINQAVCLLVLLFAYLLNRSGFSTNHWIIFAVAVLIAQLYHPLIIIGFIYLIGYEFIRNNFRKDRKLVVAFAIILLLLILKVVFMTSPYDKEKMSVGGMLQNLPHLTSLPIFSNLMHWLIRDYYLLLLFTGIICLVYIKQKRWVQLGWYLAVAAGYLVLVMLAYPTGNDSIHYYLELHYQLFALFAAIPIAYDVVPAAKNFRWLPFLFTLLLASRFVTYYFNREIFTDRLAWYDKVYDYTSQFPETRFLINQSNVPGLIAQNQLAWASAQESLLYYLSTHRKPAKTILISDNPNQYSYVPRTGDQFISAFEILPNAQLPQAYFPMEPSVYRVLNTDLNITEPPKLTGVQLEPMVKSVSAKAGNGLLRVPVKITSVALLPSGIKGNYQYQLGYKLYAGQTEVAANTNLTPLELDVQGTYQQDLLITVPDKPGSYEIIPQFIPEVGNAWSTPGISLMVK